MKNLAEDQFGHGAKVHSELYHKVARYFGPTVAKASIPFDWMFGARIQDKLPQKLPIENQGISSSCGGQAGKRMKEILRTIETGSYERLSAKSVYNPGFAYGGGMLQSELIKKLCDVGENIESDVPSYQGVNAPSEEFMIESTWRTDSLTRDALKRAGYIPVTVEIDTDSIATAVRDYYAVIITIQGQNNGTWLSPVPKPPVRGSGKPIWAHYMCSYDVPSSQGIDGHVKSVQFYQSWGENVGDHGIQTITEEYINSGFVVDCFAIVKKLTVQEKTTFMERLLDLLKQLLALQS